MRLVTLIATSFPKSKIAKDAKCFTQDTAGCAMFNQFSGTPVQHESRHNDGKFWAGGVVAPAALLPSLAEDADFVIVTRRELMAKYHRLSK